MDRLDQMPSSPLKPSTSPKRPKSAGWKSTLVNQVGSTALVTYVGLALSILSVPAITHFLGASGRGALAAAFAVSQMAAWIGFLGLQRTVAASFIRTSKLSAQAIWLLATLGLANGILVWFAAPMFSGKSEELLGLIRVTAALLPVVGLSQLGLEIALMESRMWLWNIARAGYAIVPSILYLVLALFGVLNLGTAFSATLIGQAVLAGCGCWILVSRRVSWARQPIEWGDSVKYWLSNALDSLSNRADLLALAALSSTSVLGPYAIALTISSATGGLSQAVNNSVFSRFFVANHSDVAALTRNATSKGLASGLSLGIIAIVTLHFFHGTLFGPGFADVTAIASILIASQIVSDQWMLRVYADSARASFSTLALPSALAFVVTIGLVSALSINGLLNGQSMAGVVLLATGVKLVARRLMFRNRTVSHG